MKIKREVAEYRRDECAVFLKTNERFGGLSNMAGGYPLRINDIKILTTEALYQACRFPHRPDVQKIIIGQASPMTAKMKSKSYRKDSRPDWDDVRVKIMWWCLRVKLAQNWEQFASLLLSTGNKPIVEESRRDPFWGAKPVGDQMLVGTNVLGQLLTLLRDSLRSPDAYKLLVVRPPQIAEFLLVEKPIGVIKSSGSLDSLGLANPKQLDSSDTPTNTEIASSSLLVREIQEENVLPPSFIRSEQEQVETFSLSSVVSFQQQSLF